MEDDDNGMGTQYQYLPIIATTHSQFTYFRPESIRYSAEESWSPLNIMGFRESLAIFLSLPVNYGMRVYVCVCVAFSCTSIWSPFDNLLKKAD